MSDESKEKDIRWVKYPVLDDGFVCLVDWMGDDASIAQAARVSYGSEAKTPEDDEKLIRFLMKHHHMTPFEMAELKFMVRVPMDTWRQWVRHRTASINEQSSRYRVLDDSFAKTAPEGWRKQSDTNRQGSGSPIGVKMGKKLSEYEQDLHNVIYRTYQHRIDVGVAREQARKDLPLSTYTQAYWKIDLRNLLHFLELRLAPDAQYEIRQYANAIAEIIRHLFPASWYAFEVFCLNSETFDAKELGMLARLLYARGVAPFTPGEIGEASRADGDDPWWFAENTRARRELEAKLSVLGLLETHNTAENMPKTE